jgi:hypothetical protein
MATNSFEASARPKVNGASGFTFVTGTPVAVSRVFNVSTSTPLDYTLFNANHSLAAQNISTFVDGILVDTQVMAFGANFDPVSGVAKIGFVGSSDADVDPDYQFDDLILFEGTDISTELVISPVPEPSSFALLFGLSALGFVGMRRRRA